jgi:hypothetical protein
LRAASRTSWSKTSSSVASALSAATGAGEENWDDVVHLRRVVPQHVRGDRLGPAGLGQKVEGRDVIFEPGGVGERLRQHAAIVERLGPAEVGDEAKLPLARLVATGDSADVHELPTGGVRNEADEGELERHAGHHPSQACSDRPTSMIHERRHGVEYGVGDGPVPGKLRQLGLEVLSRQGIERISGPRELGSFEVVGGIESA